MAKWSEADFRTIENRLKRARTKTTIPAYQVAPSESVAAPSRLYAGHTVSLVIPVFPPSINNYWQTATIRRRYISKAGQDFRRMVQDVVKSNRVPRFEGRIDLAILAYPPDRRKRDLDNILKALLDALQHAGVYADDSQIAPGAWQPHRFRVSEMRTAAWSARGIATDPEDGVRVTRAL